MPLQVKFNPGQLEVNLEQIGERAVRGMSEKMRRTAIKIRDLARDYAPVKTGQLEKSIDYETIKKNGRNSYVVYIDLDMLRQSGEGKVGDYAFVMEEELHPYGRAKSGKRYYRLGPGSMAKAASGKKVGGRFLSRAVKEGVKDLLSDMAAEVRRVTNSNRTIPMDYQRIEVDE
jgi:hypothetical protein